MRNASLRELRDSPCSQWIGLKVVFILLVALLGSKLQANTIITDTCRVFATPGASAIIHSCGQGNDFNFEKTFDETPGNINIGFSLTNNVAGNNPPPQTPTTYVINERIHNTSDIDWTDFEIFSPNASLLEVLSFDGPFTSCGPGTIPLSIRCEGSAVVSANGGSFGISFNLGTPFDQNAGAFAIFENPSFASEPGALAMVGLSLMMLSLLRGKSKRLG